jgi:hypothetical protein
MLGLLLTSIGPIMNLIGLIFIFFAVRRIARFLNMVEARAVSIDEHLEKIEKQGKPPKPPKPKWEDVAP